MSRYGSDLTNYTTPLNSTQTSSYHNPTIHQFELSNQEKQELFFLEQALSEDYKLKRSQEKRLQELLKKKNEQEAANFKHNLEQQPAYQVGVALRKLLDGFANGVSRVYNSLPAMPNILPGAEAAKISEKKKLQSLESMSFDNFFEAMRNKITITNEKNKAKIAKIQDIFKESCKKAMDEGNEYLIRYTLTNIDRINLVTISPGIDKGIAGSFDKKIAGSFDSRNNSITLLHQANSGPDLYLIVHEMTHFRQTITRNFKTTKYLEDCFKNMQDLSAEMHDCILSAQSCKEKTKGLTKEFQGRESEDYYVQKGKIGKEDLTFAGDKHPKRLLVKYIKTRENFIRRQLVGYLDGKNNIVIYDPKEKAKIYKIFDEILLEDKGSLENRVLLEEDTETRGLAQNHYRSYQQITEGAHSYEQYHGSKRTEDEKIKGSIKKIDPKNIIPRAELAEVKALFRSMDFVNLFSNPYIQNMLKEYKGSQEDTREAHIAMYIFISEKLTDLINHAHHYIYIFSDVYAEKEAYLATMAPTKVIQELCTGSSIDHWFKQETAEIYERLQAPYAITQEAKERLEGMGVEVKSKKILPNYEEPSRPKTAVSKTTTERTKVRDKKEL